MSVQKLLDSIIDFMPSPTDIESIKGTNPETGEEEERKPGDKEPFAALAFKVMTDPFVGKLTYFRVYSGTMTSGSHVLNATKGHKERFGRLLQMHANHREDVDAVYAGDIVAAVGLNPVSLGTWASAIMALTLLGFVTVIGLVVVLPVLGHATWHAYRDLVEPASRQANPAGAPRAGR